MIISTLSIIDSFPSFDVKPKEMTLEKSLKQGFDAPAAAFYDIPTGNHTLEIWSKLSLPQMNAAQIDFMKSLGAKSIAEPFSFSMKQSVETFGGTKTAKEFVDMPRNLANELISREDFPANIETLATTMGAIFNYYDRRLICKMYATDYIDEADTSVIAGFIC